jgi:hypothetical protein
MATPFMQLQTPSANLIPGSPGAFKVLTKDATGAAIDVSSGYTATSLIAYPATDFNTEAGGTNIAADVSFAFDTTGVTVSWTGAQASTMNNALKNLHQNLILTLSNDGGSTNSTVCGGSLVINNFNGAA